VKYLYMLVRKASIMNGAKNINYNKTSAVPKDIIALVSYGRHVVLTNTMYICRWI